MLFCCDFSAKKKIQAIVYFPKFEYDYLCFLCQISDASYVDALCLHYPTFRVSSKTQKFQNLFAKTKFKNSKKNFSKVFPFCFLLSLRDNLFFVRIQWEIRINYKRFFTPVFSFNVKPNQMLIPLMNSFRANFFNLENVKITILVFYFMFSIHSHE